MNTDHFAELFRSVNNGTINLLDSLSVFSALAELNNQSLEESEFFSAVLRTLLENQDVECCGLFIKEQDNLELVSVAQWGQSNVAVQYFTNDRLTFTSGEGEVGEAAKTGEIVHKQCKQFPGFLKQIENELPVSEEVVGMKIYPGSLMCVPLISRSVTYGVLCLHHSKSEYFKASHEHFFSLFAHFLIQMLLNNRNTRDLEVQVLKRTEQLEDALQIAKGLQHNSQDLTLVDEQTGLPNRRFFCTEAQVALARANRHGRDFSCCLLEISQFRQLVDKQGLFAGDRVLEIIADILKLQVREGDILAHFRGEQFFLALPEVDAEGAGQFADRISNVLIDAKQGIEELISLELRIGLSTNDGGLSENSQKALEELMHQADRALQAGKFKQHPIVHYNKTISVSADQQII